MKEQTNDFAVLFETYRKSGGLELKDIQQHHAKLLEYLDKLSDMRTKVMSNEPTVAEYGEAGRWDGGFFGGGMGMAAVGVIPNFFTSLALAAGGAAMGYGAGGFYGRKQGIAVHNQSHI